MQSLHIDGHYQAKAKIQAVLDQFPPRFIKAAKSNKTRLHHMTKGSTYASVSPVLQRPGVNFDSWPIPPAGLFVVEERTVYLRNLEPITIAHEFGHAIDCALGKGTYHSGRSKVIRQAFAEARDFVTPYAATGLDEYFAECLRAYVGINAGTHGSWPTVNQARLKECSPNMHAFFERYVEHGIAS